MEEKREKKYSKNRDLDHNTDTVKETEEKLSMTRELKFKKIQDEIEKEKVETKKKKKPKKPIFEDEDEIPVSIDELEKTLASKSLREKLDAIVEDEIEEQKEVLAKVEDTLESKKEEDSKEEVKEENLEVKKESEEETDEETDETPVVREEEKEKVEVKKIVNDKNIDEDIYLTTSLKPFRKRFRLRKLFRVLFTLIIIAGLGVAGYYFCFKPIYNFYLNTKPLAVYHNTLDGVKESLISSLDDDFFKEDTIYYDYNMTINTKDNSIKYLDNKTFGMKFAFSKNNEYFDSIYMMNGDNKYELSTNLINNNFYYNFSNSNVYIKSSEISDDDRSIIQEYIDSLYDVYSDTEDTKYLVEHVIDIVKDNIKEDMIKSDVEEIDVTGNSIKTMCHKLVLEGSKREQFYNNIIDSIMQDEKLVEIIASFNDIKEAKVKKYLNDMLVPKSKKNDTEEFNLYAVKGTKVIGFDYEVNGFRKLYLYVNNKNFEFHIDMSKECAGAKNCEDVTDVYDVVGNYGNNATSVEIKHNTDVIAKLSIKELNENVIDADYEIYIQDVRFKGSVYVKDTKKAEKINLSLKNDTIKTYYDLNILYKNNYKFIKETDMIKVTKYSDKVMTSRTQDFYKDMTEDEKNAFDFWWALVG